jgi:putative membrane protein insertion efficiency factor
MMNRLLRGLIRLYQLTLSPLLALFDVLGGGCRFEPTCSRYCMQALAEHGTARGLWLGIKRLARCAPWGGFGPDPVPPNPRRKLFSIPPPPVPADKP